MREGPLDYRRAEPARPFALHLRRPTDLWLLASGAGFALVGLASSFAAFRARSGGELFGAIVTGLVCLGLGVPLMIGSLGRRTVRIDADRRAISVRGVRVRVRVELREGDTIIPTEDEGIRGLAVHHSDGSWSPLITGEAPDSAAMLEDAARTLNRHL